MKQIKTNDDSFTLHSEEYDETYHSNTGALEEAEKKFIIPCGVKDGMTILDIGFGLGYNLGMALNKAKNLKIVSLEKDSRLFSEIQRLEVPSWFEKSYSIVKKLASDLEYKDENYNLKIIVGDAVETINNVDCCFDAVFLDAFSPPKNSELWTLDFFKKIFSLMKKDGVLATYSCAGQVRRNLKESGFEVKDGPAVGRRSPSTIAIKLL